MRKEYIVIPVTALTTAALLPLSKSIAPFLKTAVSENESVGLMATAQFLTLCLVACILVFVWYINPEGFKKHLRFGDFTAPAEKVTWLGVREGESWRSVGIGFSIVVTLATATFMWFGFYKDASIAWLEVLPWVLLFALTNSFSEEIICRFTLVAGLDGVLSKHLICLWSAVIFGIVHYFGTPGGLLGMLMAGFLGWLLAKSMLETRGIGWAWFIHFLQDVVIIFALIGTI